MTVCMYLNVHKVRHTTQLLRMKELKLRFLLSSPYIAEMKRYQAAVEDLVLELRFMSL